MAFNLAFTTEDYNQGKSMLIIDASSNWANVPTVDSVKFVITSLYDGVEIDPAVEVEVGIETTAFEEGFQYEITNVDLFGSDASSIPNCIFNIEMTLYNGGVEITTDGCSYTSSEVFYYNIMNMRDSYVAEVASYARVLTSKEQEYANWLDFLVLTVESNSSNSNSSAIYYVFDTYTNLNK